jgi:hypothetical protein
VPVFVKEHNYVVAFHEAGAVGGLWKVANQHVLRQAKAFFACSQVERRIVLVLICTGKHVEINPAKQSTAVEHVVNRNIRIPHLGVRHAFVGNAIHLAGKVENPL